MTSLMTKTTFSVMLLLFSITIATAQDVRYYKLTRKQENGTSSTDVSGGQFITFRGDVCFESNKNGVGVNHGTMKRNDAYSTSKYTIYQGSSYWGNEATFKFNADQSVLNVVLENGDIYIYKKATSPAGQETCSLIRKPSSRTTGGNDIYIGDYTPTPVYPDQQITPTPTPSSIPKPTPTPQPKTKDCPICHGSGKCASCNGTHRINYQFGPGYLECPNCKPDGKCHYCGGTGKVATY